MKAEVTSAFIDKYTGKLYRKGDSVDFKAARIEELEKAGFVEPDKAAAEKAAKEKEAADKAAVEKAAKEKK